VEWYLEVGVDPVEIVHGQLAALALIGTPGDPRQTVHGRAERSVDSLCPAVLYHHSGHPDVLCVVIMSARPCVIVWCGVCVCVCVCVWCVVCGMHVCVCGDEVKTVGHMVGPQNATWHRIRDQRD
jgi:hypothetical protein